MLRAIESPNTKPVQAANMSKATARVAPSFCWSVQAQEGRMRSGVVVATRMQSTWSAVSPAASSARWQATSARSDDACSGAAIRRSRIPVRSTIHSSEVSTMRSRSALVSRFSGTYIPVPVIVAPRIASGCGVMVRLDLLANVLVHSLLHERGHGADRALECARTARPVADEAHAVDAEQRRRAVLLPVELVLEAHHRRAHEQHAQHRQHVLADVL